jgi:hypothetical protein
MTLTLPKLLILLAVGWLVWRFLKKQNIVGGSKTGGAQPRAPQNQKTERAIEDMVKCPKCGSYVPAKGGHDCPGA